MKSAIATAPSNQRIEVKQKVKQVIYIAVFYAIRKSPQNRSTIPPCSLDPMPLPTIRRF